MLQKDAPKSNLIDSIDANANISPHLPKTFAGLSMTIIATRRRPVLILHLKAKYAKIDCKNEIYAKNWVRSTWTEKKVNSGKKSTVKVNHKSKSTVKVNAGKRSGQR